MTARKNALAALTACAALALAGCGSSDSSDPKSGPSSSSSASSGASKSDQACTYTSDGSAPSKKNTKPSGTPKYTGDVTVDITTNRGSLPAVLDGKDAPCAVNAVTSLATQKFYDDTPCHRVAADKRGFFILQCGDPTGTGSGGPGYAYGEEVTASTTYPAGTIAMANTGQPGSTGSQFFIVFGDTKLPPSYTVLGKLTPAGLKTAKKLGAVATKGKPDGYDGAPASKITITSFTVGS